MSHSLPSSIRDLAVSEAKIQGISGQTIHHFMREGSRIYMDVSSLIKLSQSTQGSLFRLSVYRLSRSSDPDRSRIYSRYPQFFSSASYNLLSDIII